LSKVEQLFKNNIKDILENGTWDENPRTRYESDGEVAYSKFITQVFEKYDLSKGELPITTLRPIHFKKGISEMLWIYQDQTSDLQPLEDKHGVKWWRSWEVEDTNTIGERYGKTVANYSLVDNLIHSLKTNPFSRRHIINLWQETDLRKTKGLPPCAFKTMWSVRRVNGDLYLDMTLVQRSNDYLVSGHINMMQYVSFMMMIAHECDMKLGTFARLTQNMHFYDRHLDHAKELLSRTPSNERPIFTLNAGNKSFYDITVEDFQLSNYEPVKPQLKFDLGV